MEIPYGLADHTSLSQRVVRQPVPKDQVLPKSPTSQAMACALSNWEALCRYTDAGILAIDYNAAERAIGPIALGHKNWLHLAATTAATRLWELEDRGRLKPGDQAHAVDK